MSQPSALESFILTNLDQLSIPYRLERHEAVYTMEDAKRLHLDEGTRPVKNLFLRDSAKKHFFLISLRRRKKIRYSITARPTAVQQPEFCFRRTALGKTASESGSCQSIGNFGRFVRRNHDCTG